MPNLAPTIQLPKLWLPAESTQSGTYAVLLTDCGKLFLTSGGATVTFTLPTLAAGTGFWAMFYNVQGFNMVITAPTNKLIAFNNATGTTATWSTASALIGACALVWMNDAGTFYHLAQLSAGANTVTIT